MIAAPFLVIRTVYGILEVAFSFESNSIWNPLTGNIYAFAFMCLFVEYAYNTNLRQTITDCALDTFASAFISGSDSPCLQIGVSDSLRKVKKHII